MKKGIKVLFKSISMCICLLFMASFFSACVNDEADSSAYTITGYVYDEYGTAVKGVTISSDFGDVVTDENGKYTFMNIEGSIVLSPSIKGYQFEEVSKYVKNEADDANFVAYKEYTVSGTAHNNSVAVPNANIKLSSLSGDFYTMTDENGKFKVSGVAGKTTISCEVDGVEFFSTSASLDAPNVSISTTSSLTVNVESDDQIDLSKIELWLDGSKLLFADSQKVIENVKCGSTVELRSNYYHFDKPATFVVDELNQVESFNLNRIYSVSGTVVSGQTPLENASIFVDGKLATQTNESGSYEISGIWADRVITAEYAGFKFNTEAVWHKDTDASFYGTKQITLDILLDFSGDEDISISNGSSRKEEDLYVIENASLGETVYLSSLDYYFATNSFVVGEENHYEMFGQKYYALEILGLEDIAGFSVYVDGQFASNEAIKKLYGEHSVSASYINYAFSSAVVNAGNPVARLSYKVPHSVTVSVLSNDVIIKGAKVAVGENSKTTDSLGIATLSNIFVGDEIQITKTGYNAYSCIYNAEENIEANLTYDISGYILTGTEAVEQAVVAIGDIQTTTSSDGYFEIKNLAGENNVVVTKDGFVFGELVVSQANSAIEIQSTYTISGKVEVENADIYKINIVAVSTGDSQAFLLDSTGEYQVTGLSGKTLIYVTDSSNNIALNPSSYTMVETGVCNFSASGFSVEGYVKTGEIPISYAKVTAGAISVYTDADGYYKFELLTSACEISVSKTGYEFSQNILVEEDIVDADFTATYSVAGTAAFGSVLLQGVNVYVEGNDEAVTTTDANGCFEIIGISGAKVLTFEKSGYVFEQTASVSGYISSIKAEAKIMVTISITSGGLEIAGADYYINGTKAGTADSCEIALTLSSGDVVSFEKEGCVIPDVTISNSHSYELSATYSVSASVVTGTEKITGYEVYLNGQVTKDIVVSGNTFKIDGLSGETLITVEKAGYVFETQTVTAASSVTFNGTFTISGTAFVGGKPIEGAVVTAGGKQTTTDSNGYYQISGLAGKVAISASKAGYTFDSYSNKIGAQTLTFDAYYSLSGTVKTGNLAIATADVVVVVEGSSTQLTTKTDTTGSFVISGIRGNANIIVSKDGYNSVTVEGFSDYTSNIAVNLTYSYLITFDFSVTQTVENITVYLNGEPRVVAGGSINLTNLSGVNIISFEADNRKFSVNNQEIKQPGSIIVGVYPSYNIEGYVKAELGHAIANVKIMSGSGDYCITDENGYYKFDDIAGTIYISDESITRENKNVDADGVYNFTVSNTDFAFMLYDNANDNLDGASSVQIIGDGTVVGDASIMKTTQYVHTVVKRDQAGNTIRQNLNYGETVNAVIMTVDPKVSLVAVGTNNSGTMSWEYQILRKEGNVTSTTTANHTTGGLSATTEGVFQGTFGSYPDAYSSYVINGSTSTLSSISFNDATQVYTIVFRTPMSTQTGYQKQIVQLAPSGTTYISNSSSYSQLTIQISKSGWIKQIDAHDEYKINQTADVDVTSDVTYIYYTDKPNYHINLISRNDINGSLLLSEQTEAITYSYKKYDVVSKTIYGV